LLYSHKITVKVSVCINWECKSHAKRVLGPTWDLDNTNIICFVSNLSAYVYSGIGIIITNNSGTGSTYFLVVAVLQALAGGTIIYVVVFEVLERERSKNVSGLAQLFFVILGFCVLMSVEILGKVFLQGHRKI
jgi:cytochrome bd-type quinol oxidase subunit 2